MRVFFLVLLLLHAAGAAATLILGWTGAGGAGGGHLLAGLLTALEGILLHCLLLFSFVGTGSWVRRSLPASEPGRESILAEVAGFKRSLFPLLALAILALMAATSLGGMSSVGRTPGWVHAAVGVAAVGLSLWAGWRGLGLVGRNLRLLRRVEEILGGGPVRQGGELQASR